MLNVSESTEGDIVVISLEGRLDTATSADFDFALEPHTSQDTRLLVDCGGVQYVSSAGLRVFLMAAKKLQKTGGKLVLCNMSPSVREVFDIAGFSKILHIESDREAGLKALAG
ncbi:STAS domain-containing protein [Pseudomarimonas salicorniae]|uniref:Anti-sigma factor antagonist n=1 Tax=Pseudomarimonas salicorniae TaxID=2933270 RepID=A0ABT0GEV3_9GAMM|nr:STAS domain-containing protein [Lysobacter sp. CAU 1642]MCK7593077.1 STAS domain-containing protein [Lysobacter sp. CAU 1642]